MDGSTGSTGPKLAAVREAFSRYLSGGRPLPIHFGQHLVQKISYVVIRFNKQVPRKQAVASLIVEERNAGKAVAVVVKYWLCSAA